MKAIINATSYDIDLSKVISLIYFNVDYVLFEWNYETGSSFG